MLEIDNRETEYLLYMVADTLYTADLRAYTVFTQCHNIVHTVNSHKIMRLCVTEALALVMR